ncbi:MAG: hypothetical protein ISR90_06435 [Candidatus Marinimicrobia bacterium]|nr:hypothetical protein [Candidatus Neomarinimicrobiota bacterium]MBL7023668.1 hypothetical protein [Candidatus Neomarinimicrobiota bacterium]MBL7109841.1 hypothetical protein [Candidatus Neomarinimicrobiota bacterium]
MIYNNLAVNNKIWDRLSSAWKNDKLPHAVLFYGASGSGKEAHAIELSALVNCIAPSENGACGTCPSCQKIKTFQHSNISLVIPYPRRKTIDKHDPAIKAINDKDITMLREKMEEMGQNPYSKIELDNANTILINSIRDLRKEIYMSSSEGGWKVVLIFNAEKLCLPQPESANALLKILEEPPSRTIFILVTSNINSMIETIISRSQKMYFPPISSDIIKQKMIEEGIDNEKASVMSQVANGDIRLAYKLLKSSGEIFKDIDLIFDSVFNPSSAIWQKMINRISNLKRKSQNEINYFFRLAIYLFRDLMLISDSVDHTKMVFSNMSEKLKGMEEKYQNANWANCITALEDTLGYIKANGYVPLMVTTMLGDLREILKTSKK